MKDVSPCAEFVADLTHKLTTDLAKRHGWVGIEDLRVKRMTASAKGSALAPGRKVQAKAGLNRGILDNAPGERRRQLAHKTTEFGSELRLVPPIGTSRNAALNIEALAAGWAVISTRSHPMVARPARSRMREPLGSLA